MASRQISGFPLLHRGLLASHFVAGSLSLRRWLSATSVISLGIALSSALVSPECHFIHLCVQSQSSPSGQIVIGLSFSFPLSFGFRLGMDFVEIWLQSSSNLQLQRGLSLQLPQVVLTVFDISVLDFS